MSGDSSASNSSADAPRPSRLALASAILGVLGLLCLVSFLLQGAAIALGFVARGNIRKSGGRLTGEKLARAGILLGSAGLALHVLAFVAIGLAVVYAAWTTGDAQKELSSRIERALPHLRAGEWEPAAELLGPSEAVSRDRIAEILRAADSPAFRQAAAGRVEMDPERFLTDPFGTPVKCLLEYPGGPFPLRFRRSGSKFFFIE
jgi:hypothetical protein